MTGTLTAALARLRAGIEVSRMEPATQERYEHWAKRDTWRARDEALPLLIGIDPEDYAAMEHDSAGATAEETLWSALSSALGVATPDAPVTSFALRRFAEEQSLELPARLARLLDFIALVLPSQAAGSDGALEQAVARVEERETTLGAALYFVTREAVDCLDAEGYYDSARIVDLIRARAVFWWPSSPPSLSRDEMIVLLERWLPTAPRG